MTIKKSASPKKTAKKAPAKKAQNFDVIIIGAGPAGLAFATMVSGTGLKVAIIEKQPEAALADPAYDGREIALTHLSQKIMEDAGLWSGIPMRDVSLIRDAKVLNGDSDTAFAKAKPLHFNHVETGRDNLGFMVSNHLIRTAAYEAAKSCKNVTFLTGVEVTSVDTTAQRARAVLSNGITLEAPLLVAADSRFSKSRGEMGIDAAMHDFNRLCIVTRMNHERAHDETAYECFFYDRTLAVLPLNRRHVSVVVPAGNEDGKKILSQSPEEFARDIEKRIGKRLGKMQLTEKLHAYPLVGVYAKSFYSRRFVLLGDAAVGMHPVTAHGFNFGLRGAKVLTSEIQKALELGLDIGAGEVLEKYERRHRAATRAMYLGTNALVGLYTRSSPVAKVARELLLRLGGALPPARKAIMRQLTELDAIQALS